MQERGSVIAETRRNAAGLSFRIFRNRISNDHHLIPLESVTFTYKYTNREPISDFLFDGICNVFPICYRFRDIFSLYMHDFYLDL